MSHVPKASAKGNTKGDSHTQAVYMKGASHTQASEGKKITNSSLLSLSESKEGASHTPASNLMKVSKEDDVLYGDVGERVLEEGEEDKARKAKEQLAATLKYLARELIE